MKEGPSLGALVACAIISAAGDGYARQAYQGNAASLAEAIEHRFGIAIPLSQIVRSAKLLEDSGVTVVSRESAVDPWISVDSTHFRKISESRKQANSKRAHVALFERFHTIRTFAEFGNDWLEHAIGTFENDKLLVFEDSLDEPLAAASDRLVTLHHNQQLELDQAATELIDSVEQQNGIDGDLTLKQKIVGQLRAGRELIRAQTFNAYLMYQTLMTVLGGLIEKYKDQALGHAAKKLFDLLVEHIFGK